MSAHQNPDRSQPHNKILVIKLGALGDFIQSLGCMRAIRQHHPEAKITLLTTKSFEKIAKDCGYFDDIWLDDKPRFFELGKWLALKKRLNQARFERVYDLQNNDRTGLYFTLLKTPKPEWSGIVKGASHRNADPQRFHRHAFKGHVQTLMLAGIPEHLITIDPLDWAQGNIEGLKLRKPYIVFAAGSAPNRKEKRWPAHYYGALAQTLSDQGYQVVLIGTMAELDVNAKIKALCPDALDLTAKTCLFDLVALARGAAATIGNDTGPMHLMAPTGTPAFVIFSSHSNPEIHAPLGKAVHIFNGGNLALLTAEAVLSEFQKFMENHQKEKISSANSNSDEQSTQNTGEKKTL
ncbi:MAG: glycosyltransferase family 9 protein [Alphaproteobacteria bacterium]